jgi:uncharacterized cupin superfamily protein
MAERDPKPIHTHDMDWSEYRETDQVRFRYKYFPDPDSCHVGFGIMELPPGCHTGTAHYHMKEEEQLYVLAGTMEVRLGRRWHAIGPGDYVWFPAGEATEHKLRNRAQQPCQFFLLGERKRDEVVVYPDVDQVHVRLLMERFGRPVQPTETLDDE